MKSLRNKNKIIIKLTDKNLSTKTYLQLSLTEAITRYKNVKNTLKNIITSNPQSFSKSELFYFQRSFEMLHRLPIFYGLPKVHKNPIFTSG